MTDSDQLVQRETKEGRTQGAGQIDITVGVVDGVEEAEHHQHLGVLEKAGTAPGRAGDPRILKCQLKLFISGSGAGQNGNVRRTDGCAVIQPAFAQQSTDLCRNPAIFEREAVIVLPILGGRTERDGYRYCILGSGFAADQIVCRDIADRLAAEAEQIGENAVGAVDDGAITTEIVRHKDRRIVALRVAEDGKGAAVVGKNVRLGTAEPVDALFNVADHKAGARTGNGAENAVLYSIDILVLVDTDDIELLGKRGGNIGVGIVFINQK